MLYISMYVCKRVHLKNILKQKCMHESCCAAFSDVLFFMPFTDFFIFIKIIRIKESTDSYFFLK